MKILILDDQYNRVIQFEKRLKPLGFTDITHVTTANECIEALSKKKFDIIFLDYDLGEPPIWAKDMDVSGEVVARWFKEHPKNKNRKAQIIIHSTDHSGAERMRELMPGANLIPGAWQEDKFSEVNMPALEAV